MGKIVVIKYNVALAKTTILAIINPSTQFAYNSLIAPAWTCGHCQRPGLSGCNRKIVVGSVRTDTRLIIELYLVFSRTCTFRVSKRGEVEVPNHLITITPDGASERGHWLQKDVHNGDLGTISPDVNANAQVTGSPYPQHTVVSSMPCASFSLSPGPSRSILTTSQSQRNLPSPAPMNMQIIT